jgi:hypothetical protein
MSYRPRAFRSDLNFGSSGAREAGIDLPRPDRMCRSPCLSFRDRERLEEAEVNGVTSQSNSASEKIASGLTGELVAPLNRQGAMPGDKYQRLFGARGTDLIEPRCKGAACPCRGLRSCGSVHSTA